MLECWGLNLYIISCRVVEKSATNFLVNKFLTWITNGLPMKNNYLSLCLIIRNLFQNKNRTDAEQLGRLVEYVRKNIQHLDSLPTEHVLQDGRITWLPLNEQFEEGDKEDNDWFGLTFWSSDLQAVDWISTNTTFNWFFFVKLIQFDLSLRSNLKSLVYSSKFYLRIVGVVFSFALTLKKLSRPRNSDAILLGSKLCFRRMKFVTWYLNTVGYPRKPNELLKR